MPKPHTARPKIHWPGLGRRHSWRHRQVYANHWANWAAVLHARHTRIGYRCRALSLVLGRNQAATRHRVNHRHYRSWQLLKLSFSIGPLFLRFVSALRMPAARSTLRGLAPLDAIANAQSRSDHGQLSKEQKIPRREGAFIQTAANGLPNTTILLPITRVSSRLHETLETQLSTRLDVQSVGQSVQLVNRVINERMRLEEQTRRTLVTRHLRENSKSETVRRDQIVSESERTAPSVSTQRGQVPGSWPFDIERLTDQVVRSIDSRILAHRERMGNVF
jgi:hypothetical protein